METRRVGRLGSPRAVEDRAWVMRRALPNRTLGVLLVRIAARQQAGEILAQITKVADASIDEVQPGRCEFPSGAARAPRLQGRDLR
jgi:hypothetical protein